MLPENENDDLTSDNEQSETDEMETAENSDRQFHRRKNKYLVCSIDTSLDENNYDMIDIANVEEKEIDVPLEKKGSHTKNYLDYQETEHSSTEHSSKHIWCQTRISWQSGTTRCMVNVH